MDNHGSDLRRLSAEDFSPEQVAGWIDAGGHAAAPRKPEDEAAKADWFVAYTNPRREADVVRVLAQRSLQAYMPAMLVTRRGDDVRRPLFPRYVLFGLTARRSFYDLRETPGLEAVVRMSGQPVTMPARDVEALIAQECEGVFDMTDARLAEIAAAAQAERLARFAPGASVRISDGPWCSFHGRVTEQVPPDRLIVEISLFGRAWPVPMRIKHVELLGKTVDNRPRRGLSGSGTKASSDNAVSA